MYYPTRIYLGAGGAGDNVLFAHIDRNERVDYVLINPHTRDIIAWTSTCSNLAPLPPVSPSSPQNPKLPPLPKVPALPPLPPLSPFGSTPAKNSPTPAEIRRPAKLRSSE